MVPFVFREHRTHSVQTVGRIFGSLVAVVFFSVQLLLNCKFQRVHLFVPFCKDCCEESKIINSPMQEKSNSELVQTTLLFSSTDTHQYWGYPFCPGAFVWMVVFVVVVFEFVPNGPHAVKSKPVAIAKKRTKSFFIEIHVLLLILIISAFSDLSDDSR
jgi:hypothetical protein